MQAITFYTWLHRENKLEMLRNRKKLNQKALLDLAHSDTDQAFDAVYNIRCVYVIG